MTAVAKLPGYGLIVTAPGSDCDFVSRFFAPQSGVPEDPVTGSAHCTLIPYWSKRLGKARLHARQVSPLLVSALPARHHLLVTMATR